MSQISDSAGLTQANTIKNETVNSANTATRVGDDHVDLWDSKGNKQEANTWTGKQTFTPNSTNAGFSFGVLASGTPSSMADGDAFYRTSSGAYYGRNTGVVQQFIQTDGAVTLSDGRILIASNGQAGSDSDLTFTGGNTLNTPNLIVSTAGSATTFATNQLKITEGSNLYGGVATLSSGSVVVSTTAVAANSRIYLTGQSDGGTPGWLRVSARSAGTSFTITSSSGTDTSTVAWLIVTPN